MQYCAPFFIIHGLPPLSLFKNEKYTFYPESTFGFIAKDMLP
jgi:hypothetical protein